MSSRKQRPSGSLSPSPPASNFDSDSELEVFHSADALKIYLLDEKLTADAVNNLYLLVDSIDGLELCPNAEDADIIVTALRMTKRFQRHVDLDLARQKAIVTPEWLQDSAERGYMQPYDAYAALGVHADNVEEIPSTTMTSTAYSLAPVDSDICDDDTPLDHTARYSCLRNSPLVCPNQELVRQLAVLRLHRDFEGLDINALSYDRAIAAIKAYPHKITESNLHTEVPKLPYIGSKILSKIEEFVDSSQISECSKPSASSLSQVDPHPLTAEISSSQRFQSLSEFTSIYGIGHTTARELYSRGLRTIEDLWKYYNLPPNFDARNFRIMNMEPPPNATTGNKKRYSKRTGKTASKREKLPDISVQVGLALHHELIQKIPRAEVEEMHRVVMHEMETLKPGCVSTITGGYRRGKSHSNDVDIIISHPELNSGKDEVRQLGTRLVQHLYDKGLVTHVMHSSSFHSKNDLRTSSPLALQNALTIFLLPKGTGTLADPISRRLDMIFAAPEVYWTAVVGWTGGKMFERDIRLCAKEKGLKFDSSGIFRRHDLKQLFPKSEREVFKMLGVPWVAPHMRNTDA